MLAGITFRKEPFFAGADNVDQLYKIAKANKRINRCDLCTCMSNTHKTA